MLSSKAVDYQQAQIKCNFGQAKSGYLMCLSSSDGSNNAD